MKKLLEALVGKKCPAGGDCSYDPDAGIYTIRGKKYSSEFFDILQGYDTENVYRVVTRGNEVFTIKKLPLA